ncbi:MAG: hypothetical protein ACK4FB_08020 [Brevundimonas sp.]|uniref:hypothetical protein n=1 Tax=Brevundimonas sp. TaxID=1871086 RepID=UPI00391C4C88
MNAPFTAPQPDTASEYLDIARRVALIHATIGGPDLHEQARVAKRIIRAAGLNAMALNPRPEVIAALRGLADELENSL